MAEASIVFPDHSLIEQLDVLLPSLKLPGSAEFRVEPALDYPGQQPYTRWLACARTEKDLGAVMGGSYWSKGKEALSMAQPISYDVVFDEHGNPRFSEDAVALIRARLGHAPTPGETLTLVEPVDEFAGEEDQVETWIRSHVIPAYEALRADPSRAIPAASMRAELAEWQERQTASGS